MRIQLGKTAHEIDRGELLARIAGHARVLIDVGTGDGRFVYRWAGAHPDVYCIGIDPVGERMQEISFRATRKAARGGRPNALFVVASVHELPHELDGLAQAMAINYPWASLLLALVRPDMDVLAGLRRLMVPGGELAVLINQSVFEDRPYAARLGLPELTEDRIEEVLRPAYLAAGFDVRESRIVEGAAPHQTTWGQHLTLASGRKTRSLAAMAVESGPPCLEAVVPAH